MDPSSFASKVLNLESEVAKLSISIGRWEAWLALWTLVVVIGLVFELFEVVAYLHEQRTRWLLWKPLEFKEGLVILGAIFVMAGVTGELWVEYKTDDLNSKRDADERGINRLRTDEAREAEGKIADAQKTAALAIENAAKLGVDVGSLEVFVARQRGAVASALLALKALDDAVRDAKAKAESLEKRMAPRGFDLSQQKGIVEALKASVKGPVYVIPALFDSTDAHALAEQVSDLLSKGGFTLSDPGRFKVMVFSNSGASMTFGDFDHPPPQTLGVQQAFKAGGLLLLASRTKPELFPGLKPDELVIEISSHP